MDRHRLRGGAFGDRLFVEGMIYWDRGIFARLLFDIELVPIGDMDFSSGTWAFAMD